MQLLRSDAYLSKYVLRYVSKFYPRTSLEMDGTLDFDCYSLGEQDL